MKMLDNLSLFLNRLLLWIGGCFLAIMILLIGANIFLRVVWIPIKGTFELMGFLGAVVTAFALSHTQRNKGHMGIDVVVNLFSDKTRRILSSVNYLACSAFFTIVGWQMTRWAAKICATGELTETLRIAFYPFTYAVAFGCFVLALDLVTEFLRLFIKEGGD